MKEEWRVCDLIWQIHNKVVDWLSHLQGAAHRCGFSLFKDDVGMAHWAISGKQVLYFINVSSLKIEKLKHLRVDIKPLFHY